MHKQNARSAAALCGMQRMCRKGVVLCDADGCPHFFSTVFADRIYLHACFALCVFRIIHQGEWMVEVVD